MAHAKHEIDACPVQFCWNISLYKSSGKFTCVCIQESEHQGIRMQTLQNSVLIHTFLGYIKDLFMTLEVKSQIQKYTVSP